MSDPLSPAAWPRELAELLSATRRRVRRYVWWEGLGVVLTVAGLAVWLSLAIDYFLEPPAVVRVGLLAAAGVGVSVAGWRSLVARLWAPLNDGSLALALERQFGQLGDSLHTAVDLAGAERRGREEGSDPPDPALVAATYGEAVERSRGLRLADLFDPAPVTRAVAGAVLVWGALGLVAGGNPATLGLWARRYFLLSDELWPRRTRLVAPDFDNRAVKIARGRDFVLRVEAALDHEVPPWVEVRYWTISGTTGRAMLTREGKADPRRDAAQRFAHRFAQVLGPLELEVRGGDARLRGLKIEVVDEPSLAEAELACEYPPYLNRPAERVPVAGRVALPAGTTVRLLAAANKPLLGVELRLADSQVAASPSAASPPDGSPAADSSETVPVAATSEDQAGQALRLAASDLIDEIRLDVPLGELRRDQVWLIELADRDGIRSREPIRLQLVAVPDKPPLVRLRSDGVSAAITPQARIPVRGLIEDDYALGEVAWQWSVDSAAATEQPFEPGPAGADRWPLETRFDLEPLALRPGQRLSLSIAARDRCGLGGPQTTVGEPLRFEIVTADALYALLAQREINLRRSLETIREEIDDSRRQLADLQAAPESPALPPPEPSLPSDARPAPATEAGTTETNTATPPAADEDELTQLGPDELAVLRILQLARKNADEILGIAGSVEGIRDELAHNRLDTPELSQRLTQGIAAPLRQVGGDEYARLLATGEALRLAVRGRTSGEEPRAEALATLGTILDLVEQVLTQMRALETFNEAVDTLRGIIADQEQLNQETQAERRRRARRLLEEE